MKNWKRNNCQQQIMKNRRAWFLNVHRNPLPNSLTSLTIIFSDVFIEPSWCPQKLTHVFDEPGDRREHVHEEHLEEREADVSGERTENLFVNLQHFCVKYKTLYFAGFFGWSIFIFQENKEAKQLLLIQKKLSPLSLTLCITVAMFLTNLGGRKTLYGLRIDFPECLYKYGVKYCLMKLFKLVQQHSA